MAEKSFKSTCHCGNITVTVHRLPKEINECQCTICRRYSAAWGYYKIDEVKVDIKEGAKTLKYVWGDKTNSFNFCENCGCVCYWWPLDEKRNEDGSTADFGLNTRNMDPMDLFFVDRKIERSWILAPIDNPANAHAEDKAGY